MATRALQSIAFPVFLAFTLNGCATTQQAIGGALMAVGAGTTVIAIGDSMDGHPKGHPEITTRRADPSIGIPIAMAGGVLFVVGGIIYLATPKHHGGTSQSP